MSKYNKPPPMPLRIYLQVADTDGEFANDLHDMTWCSTRVNASDVCYVRSGKKIEKEEGT